MAADAPMVAMLEVEKKRKYRSDLYSIGKARLPSDGCSFCHRIGHSSYPQEKEELREVLRFHSKGSIYCAS